MKDIQKIKDLLIKRINEENSQDVLEDLQVAFDMIEEGAQPESIEEIRRLEWIGKAVKELSYLALGKVSKEVRHRQHLRRLESQFETFIRKQEQETGADLAWMNPWSIKK